MRRDSRQLADAERAVFQGREDRDDDPAGRGPYQPSTDSGRAMQSMPRLVAPVTRIGFAREAPLPRNVMRSTRNAGYP